MSPQSAARSNSCDVGWIAAIPRIASSTEIHRLVETPTGLRTVKVSNPDKVYFSARGETKLDLVQYYLSVADGIVRALYERPTVLKRQLAMVREHGYAVTAEEHEIGLAAIGAPIRTLDGHVVAAVTASGPTFRINEDTLPELVKHVQAAAAEISQRHGYPRHG